MLPCMRLPSTPSSFGSLTIPLKRGRRYVCPGFASLELVLMLLSMLRSLQFRVSCPIWLLSSPAFCKVHAEAELPTLWAYTVQMLTSHPLSAAFMHVATLFLPCPRPTHQPISRYRAMLQCMPCSPSVTGFPSGHTMRGRMLYPVAHSARDL